MWDCMTNEARQTRLSKLHTASAIEKMAATKRGKHYYNNGVVSILMDKCPEGFKPGRLSHKNTKPVDAAEE